MWIYKLEMLTANLFNGEPHSLPSSWMDSSLFSVYSDNAHYKQITTTYWK